MTRFDPVHGVFDFAVATLNGDINMRNNTELTDDVYANGNIYMNGGQIDGNAYSTHDIYTDGGTIYGSAWGSVDDPRNVRGVVLPPAAEAVFATIEIAPYQNEAGEVNDVRDAAQRKAPGAVGASLTGPVCVTIIGDLPAGTVTVRIVRQQLVLVDRTGQSQALLPGAKRLANPRFSPSGDRVAVTIANDGSTATATDIWIVTVASRQLARLTNDGRSSQPEWSPDGKRIIWLFKSDSSNEVRTQSWDGSGKPETIPTPGHSFNSAVPSPAGGSFVSSQFTAPPALPEDIWVTPMAGGSASRTLLRADADEYMPRLSSDGKWMAYISSVDGTNYEVYVTPADGSGSPRQISTGGGFEPMWSPVGLSLFYRSGGRLVESRITSPSPFQVATDTVFTDSYRQDVAYPAFDVARDGQHFLMLRTGDQRERVVVTIGWFDELRARMGQVAKK
jgi:hypothetical protein